MVVLGSVLGIVSSIFISEGRAVTIWAIVVSVVFFLSAATSVIFHYSWMFTNEARAVADAIALASAVTGIIYALRSSD